MLFAFDDASIALWVAAAPLFKEFNAHVTFFVNQTATLTPARSDYVAQVCEAMDRARKNREVVVFYAHAIGEKAPGHFINPAPLREMLAHAKAIGLPAIGLLELPYENEGGADKSK